MHFVEYCLMTVTGQPVNLEVVKGLTNEEFIHFCMMPCIEIMRVRAMLLQEYAPPPVSMRTQF